MTECGCPARREGFLVQELDDELVLYHPEQTRALCLNATASLIWRLCDGTTSSAEMVDLLRGAFPEAENIEGDVEEALERFARHGALRMT